MLEKWVLTVLELDWNQRLGHEKTKLNICQHRLMSSAHLQNWPVHVIEGTRTSTKYQKMKHALTKRAKILCFIVKYANLGGFLLPSSSWLLKLPFSNTGNTTHQGGTMVNDEELSLALAPPSVIVSNNPGLHAFCD